MITTAGMTGLACFVPNITTPDIFEYVAIGSILTDIQTGKHSVALSALPDPTQNATEYKRLKKKLPSWALNGTFTKKVDNNSFCESSGYFGLDIDRLNHTDLLNTKEILVNQPYVTAVWLSPSKQGLKVLLRVADDLIHSDKAFKDVYNKVEFAMA